MKINNIKNKLILITVLFGCLLQPTAAFGWEWPTLNSVQQGFSDVVAKIKLWKAYYGDATVLIDIIESDKTSDEKIELLKEALKTGTNVNAKNNDGDTPLHYAAYKGDLKIVTFLVEKGADINAKDDKGWTPLHRAAYEGHLAIVKFLVENGANVNAKDSDGKTAFDFAKNPEVRSYLTMV